MSVELGPGLISNIYDGIQRPLEEIRAKIGNSLARGVEVPSLDREKKWHFTPVVRQGDAIVAGDVIGTVQETEIVLHKIMVPVGVVGTIKSIEEGDYNITETVAVIETANGTEPVSYTHLRAHETRHDLVCRLLLEKKKTKLTEGGLVVWKME